MFLKRKNMEMFEVFRKQRRLDGRPTELPESERTAGETGRPVAGALAQPEAESEPERTPAEAAPAAPSPFVQLRSGGAEPLDSLGERSVVIRYNTALVALILSVGALLVAFALGVEVGRDRATRDLAYVGAKDPGALAPAAADQGSEADGEPVTFSAGGAGQAARLVAGPDAERSDPPAAAPSRYWTIRMIHYNTSREGQEAAERMVKRVSESVGDGAYKVVMRINEEPKLAVCYGQFTSDGESAQQELRRVRALRESFRGANLVLVERAAR